MPQSHASTSRTRPLVLAAGYKLTVARRQGSSNMQELERKYKHVRRFAAWLAKVQCAPQAERDATPMITVGDTRSVPHSNCARGFRFARARVVLLR